ncbi:MAG: hypothetical protein HQL68_12055, partial [Magnetococcales bacterium]|nr:hypothetical protein [Magnetococcales bacterium]
MIIIPAIDLKDGNCVRLFQGDMDQDTLYSNDPGATAAKWQELGAERLHVVDLNGAFAGKPVNAPAIAAIVKALDIPMQLGGGIRSLATMEKCFEKVRNNSIPTFVQVDTYRLMAHSKGDDIRDVNEIKAYNDKDFLTIMKNELSGNSDFDNMLQNISQRVDNDIANADR